MKHLQTGILIFVALIFVSQVSSYALSTDLPNLREPAWGVAAEPSDRDDNSVLDSQRPEKRPLPEITLKNLRPPYPDYEYFKDHRSFPFNPYAERFDLVNAWWLIEASTLVFASPGFVTREFEKAGFSDVRFFSGRSTQCFTARKGNFTVVAFRGTEVRSEGQWYDILNIINDLRTDFSLWMDEIPAGGKVHHGFNEALDEVWEKEGLRAYLDALRAEGSKIWLTGHSLGAALATVAASRYPYIQGLYTFGSPKVGDEEFRNRFPVTAYRFVHHNDVVTELPPFPPYVHVGKLKYIDAQGEIHEEIPQTDENSELLGSLPSLRDHVPLFYAIHLWNQLRLRKSPTTSAGVPPIR